MNKNQATATATIRFFKRHFPENFEFASREISDTKIRVSALGLGSYRMSAQIDGHDNVIKKAVQSGINLLDTSANYMDGDAEILIGEALTELIDAEIISRNEIVVCSKAGYIQGKNYSEAEYRKKQDNPYPETVEYDTNLWHCIHPEFLEDQITASRTRLKLDCIDIFLLHNPEYFLVNALKNDTHNAQKAFEIFYDRIYRAFLFLESAVQKGWIQFYGISSNSMPGDPGRRDFVDISKIWEIYQNCCRQLGTSTAAGHFKVVQMPYNWLEQDALTLPNTQFTLEPQTVLNYCQKKNLAVFTNRPLNAIVRNQLFRISKNEFNPALDYNKSLEEIRTSVKTSVGLIKTVISEISDNETLLRVAENLDMCNKLNAVSKKLTSPEQLAYEWENYFYPNIQRNGAFLLQNCAANIKPEIKRHLIDYSSKINKFVQTLGESVAKQQYELFRKLDVSYQEMNPAFSSLSLSEKALHFVKSTENVTSVLNGMRREKYVEAAKHVLNTPSLTTAEIQNLIK